MVAVVMRDMVIFRMLVYNYLELISLRHCETLSFVRPKLSLMSFVIDSISNVAAPS